MKLNSAFFYSLLALSISQLTMSADVWAQNQEEEEADRWFEVEVILFKQLGNKAELKEQFPKGINASNLPIYQQSFDLLSPYFQPNLTSIKQFMPLCGEQDEQHLFLEPLQDVAQVGVDKNFITLEATIEKTTQQKSEQSNLVSFEFDLQKEALAKPIFSTKDLCIISQKEMESLLDEKLLAHFNLDSFGVDALPSRLNASGAHNSDSQNSGSQNNSSPYLIADDSLLLKDISQRLRWSKEFKPLLHFGWRQVGITQNDAIPLKLFAGDHIEYQYQQALTEYQSEVKEVNAIEKNLLEQLTQAQTQAQTQTQDITKMTKAERKQQALTLLLSRIENMDKNQLDENAVSDIVSRIEKHSRIEKQNFDAILAKHDVESTSDDPLLDDQPLGNQSLDMSTPPKKPLQPWFLDGFLKIHLDHYLYITADFNVLNQDQFKPLSENDKTDKTDDVKADEVKLVNFSQTRRVITGEIHYFDHPYIGMIVQIRRFDPTMPVGEQVSQAIR